MVDAILTNTMLPQMSIALLERQMSGEEISRINVGVGEGGFTYSFEAKGKAVEAKPTEAKSEPKAQPVGETAANPVAAE